MNPKMENMKALEQLENMKRKDEVELNRTKQRIIAELKNTDKSNIRNSVSEQPKKERLGFLWRLKRVLGMH
jgi:hypothetical protein